MVEVKAGINDFFGQNNDGRNITLDQVEETLAAAGIQAEVRLHDINVNGELIITSTTATVDAIRKAIEGCDGIAEVYVENPDDPDIDLQGVVEE